MLQGMVLRFLMNAWEGEVVADDMLLCIRL